MTQSELIDLYAGRGQLQSDEFRQALAAPRRERTSSGAASGPSQEQAMRSTATEELQALISEVEALKAKIDQWGRAEAYITDAGLGLSDVLSQWLGEAEREIATAHDHAMVHEMRRRQSVNGRGAE